WSRAYVYDNSGFLGTNSVVPYLYNQNAAGVQAAGTPTTPGTNARIMILSTLARQLPISSGGLSAANFDAIWSTAGGDKPTTWTNWAGKGEDLLIQRINVEPIFHRVLLVNADIGSQPYFSINGNQLPVPAGGGGQNAYYIRGTVLGLRGTNQIQQIQE